ncbi:MAG: T9SS type A sorting domain-containing protein, partial [Bacteroidales bacterium]|nr:T9SS type A sorting domain-containing protein [Bacteroidales bacterium]
VYYQSDTNWNKFKDIQEGDMEYMVSMDVNNNEYGIATASAPDCIKYESTLKAIPNFGYTFEKWSDGNSDNPRTVVVTSDTSFTAMFVYGVSIEESNSDQELRLYPNPSNYKFTLDNGQSLMKEVYLYDVMGRNVQHLPVNAPSTTIDVSDLPNGIYVVKINTASGVLVRKVQVVR